MSVRILLDKEINIDSWLQAARECDTRSDVIMAFSSSASFSVGEKWRYPQTGAIQWKGTVSKVETLGGKKQITFTDIIGKLGTKWNSYKTFASGELYWYVRVHVQGRIRRERLRVRCL